MVSSYPPRLCGIGTFTEEAREFIQNANPKREVLVVSHTEGQGEGVLPLIDTSRQAWWKPVANALEQLNPYVVHIEHGPRSRRRPPWINIECAKNDLKPKS